MIPFAASMSGAMTLTPPTSSSPSTVLSIRTEFSPSRVRTSIGRSNASASAAVYLPLITCRRKMSPSSGFARSSATVISEVSKNVLNAWLFGANTVKGPALDKSAAITPLSAASTAARSVANSRSFSARTLGNLGFSSAEASTSVATPGSTGSVSSSRLGSSMPVSSAQAPRAQEASAVTRSSVSVGRKKRGMVGKRSVGGSDVR
mmetsp:Transcript_13671/g.51131  ORF Transcript_13671/g.51131 Transcript_13671/m.51131 type:complete len:205 (-) Transcript_13671:98-712(-)